MNVIPSVQKDSLSLSSAVKSVITSAKHAQVSTYIYSEIFKFSSMVCMICGVWQNVRIICVEMKYFGPKLVSAGALSAIYIYREFFKIQINPLVRRRLFYDFKSQFYYSLVLYRQVLLQLRAAKYMVIPLF